MSDWKCPECGKGYEDHPSLDVSHVTSVQVCGNRVIAPEVGDRHPKWRRVEPGTPVEAGRNYRVEYPSPLDGWKKAVESQAPPEGYTIPSHGAWLTYEWFVDSSWKPPLVLPSESTWGIALCRDWHRGVSSDGWILDRWHLSGEWFRGHETASEYDTNPDEPGTNVLDFIELTPEQVARVEAAR